MCGIAGAVNPKGKVKTEECLSGMLRSLKRRGPDASGIRIFDCAILFHTRLAVIDIENGAQPMEAEYEGERYTIVYNGELYNTEEVRRELAGLGESFSGHSDTEVVLKAYIRWKEKCLSRFNGIFAFAVWEKKKRRLFFARDRMGVKPFFYSCRNGTFVFGSEIKALLEYPDIEPIIDRNGIAELLFVGPGRTPGCGVFRDISELKPGQCGTFSDSGLVISTYWKLHDRVHTDSFEETSDRVRFLITDAIRRQLVSDVPVGTFLSGGLDSSIISAVAADYFRKRGEKLNTFSVTYTDNQKYFRTSRFQPTTDEPYIRLMADFLGSIHHTFTVDNEQLAFALKRAVDARDLPGMADVDSSLLLFCEEIRKHVTVALSGECADEIFGGYPWYRDEKIRAAYGFPWAQSTDMRQKFLAPSLRAKIDGHAEISARYEATLAETDKADGLSPAESRLREMVHMNMYWFMQTLLDRKDRMSMYSGLEVRVPFCDHRIAEYMYSVPWEMKEYQGMEKGLLRHAVKGLLPEEIRIRKKSPYPKTHNPQYTSVVSSMLRKIIADTDAPIFGLVDRDALSGLLKDEFTQPWYGQLMTGPQTMAYMIQLNYWLEKYRVRIDV